MHNLLTKASACLFGLLLRFIYDTNRLTVTGRDIFDRYADQGGTIFVCWHSRIFYLPSFYANGSYRHPVSALASMSRDGDYAAACLRKLKMDPVRGSSSRGGQSAVRRLAQRLAKGNNIAVTPDGPRGPARKVSEGVIKLAQITGAKIVPASYDATRKKRLNSWDRFIVVLPFGRVHLAVGEPIEVPRRISAAEREAYRAQLERALKHLDDLCATRLGCPKAEVGESQLEVPSQRTEA